MRVDVAQYPSQKALHALGAFSIAEVLDENDVVIGYDLTPDVDLSGYDAAAAKADDAVPSSVSRAQAKIQLLRTPGSTKTLLDDVKAAVEGAGGEVEIWFTDATTWERSNPYVAQLGGALNLTDEQIDELFVAAAKIAA